MKVTEGIALIELEVKSQTAETPAKDAPKSRSAKAEIKPVEAEPQSSAPVAALSDSKHQSCWM